MGQKTITIAAQPEYDDFVAAMCSIYKWDGQGSDEDFAWNCVQSFITNATHAHKHKTMVEAVSPPAKPTVVLS